ncbi:ATP-binding sensor histidine kinase [Dyella sp. C11]|uniref:trifunctional serine/threonine-protein kinase/ATP-binding protein/sensor histidine kinase n=1 Tax=Dyella sp. C11 TaxID=2126991 RepID=UPI0018E540E0|nr:ATP-binding sensor histidine kinase [Dyella sp. C11]
MKASSLLGAGWEEGSLEVLWEDGERAFCRTREDDKEAERFAFIPLRGGDEHSTGDVLARLVHEISLKEQLDTNWAIRPLELVRDRGRTMLVVDYEKGEPLNLLLGQPAEIGWFLNVATSLAAALRHLHGSGIVHKDIKPANVIFDASTGNVRLTGFGIASRLLRERQSPEPPEFIAGTLAYMAPEQTGRVNRSIDSRSDLYSLGVTFYEMLTGSLPFMAADPMEWVHCHVAREPRKPSDQLKSIPGGLSAIVMKLLAKTAEERYQTAAGVESDLRRCEAQWNQDGRIDDFELGTEDMPDHLMIPERLYGRDHELETLLNAFDRVVAGGRPELVLVSGYSGIGKSAVVNELHKPLVPPRGLFAAGKFDQYKRDIPYATLAQAFQSLIRPLLSKNEEELRFWRESLDEALGPNGQLIADLVPEVRHIIGDPPPVPELPPQDAQRRFQFVFRRFISVFARPEHPLALFLDDLQWLDAATLDLLEDILVQADLKHLLLIGAYRDNEVGSTHPLMRKLDAMRQAGAGLQDIVLAPLSMYDLSCLLSDSLHCSHQNAEPLARLLHEKTSGNPFFAIQFISALSDEGLLAFDYMRGRWSWSLESIRAKGYTDNVVELMVGKLIRLPTDTQRALQQFACMGNSAEFGMLQKVYQTPLDDMHQHLWEAVRAGLIFKSDNAYRFLHDRVQEGAYSLIPEDQRAAAHLRIGMLLAEHIPPNEREEAIFEIVNQLNRGAHLLSSSEDRAYVADLNLIAGRRAKVSTAYASALKYLREGRSLLQDDAWEKNYSTIFQLEYLMADCELLTANMAAAELRLERLSDRTRNRHDLCVTTRLRLTLYTTLDRCDRSAEVFLEWLRHEGTTWSKRPTQQDAQQEYDRIWKLLGDRSIEDLLDVPLITDPDVLDTLDVFTEIVTPSILYDEHFSSLVVCRLVTLSLEHGNSDAAGFAYVWLAMFAGPRFGNYRDGFRFGHVGYDLVEKRGLTRYQARTYMSIGAMVTPWEEHVANGRDLIKRAVDAAHRIGDLTFAAYSWDQLITVCLAVGDPLGEVQTEAENGLAFAKMQRFGLVIELCGAQLGLIRGLRGKAALLGNLDHDDYTEVGTERRLASNPNLVFAEFYYWTRKLQGRVIAGDISAAVEAARNGHRLLWTSAGMFETADFHFYAALAHAAAYGSATDVDKQEHHAVLTAHSEQNQIWSDLNPATFENRSALVNAELARVEGRLLDAQDLYEQAIRSARKYGYVHNEAIANERAGTFYEARGFEKIAFAYFRDARLGYLRWGADGKARQLEARYPQLLNDRSGIDATSTILTSVDRLDLATVIKVSEAVSGEMVFERLMETLMRTAIEHAGAQRGSLILPVGNGYQLAVEVETSRDGLVTVAIPNSTVGADDLPQSVLHYVARTKEIVVLHDASTSGPFVSDNYIHSHQTRSVLCMPIVKQAMLLGIMYLENDLTSDAFTASRLAILKLLASEAAISFENARLYQDLASRESRIRRLVDANIIGIFIWDIQGRILEANEAFLRMLGYDHDDMVSKGLRWTDLTPPEWLDNDRRKRVPVLEATGCIPPYEKEFFRKTGERVPVLIGVAAFEEKGSEGVAFVLDLTERRLAADALRELQAELTHANRLATMGQLVASIAHEVIQPIGAARNNANAALRFLASDQQDLGEVREAIECVVSDTYRAGSIVGRIRDQVKKLPPRQEGVDLNYAIEEVIALVRGELSKSHVEVHMDLAKHLPPAHGDRVQLQQVILNLVINAIEAMAGVEVGIRQLSVTTTSDASNSILVALTDSGPGVDIELRDRIFESFYTTKADGVGIGLSICRSIIEAHGGRLWADAAYPRGAIFRFTLPTTH